MKKILLASQNRHKAAEYRAIFKRYAYEIITLNDLNDGDQVRENGQSFAENALLKVEYYARKYQLDVLADDSGLSIAYFNDEPGYRSARFWDHLPYRERNELICALMQGIKQRAAYFTCVIAFIHNGQKETFTGIFNGEVAAKPQGMGGFGYDPLFYLPPYRKTVAELPAEIKNKISHRALAMKELVAYLEK